MALIGKVVALIGTAYLITDNGAKRELQLGDTVQTSDTIQTMPGADVELELANGRPMHIGPEQLVAFTEDLTNALGFDSLDGSVNLATIETVIKAIESGKDVNEVLEETAAGGNGLMTIRGFDFVALLRINDVLNQFGFQYDFNFRANIQDQPITGRIVDDNNGVGTFGGGSTTPPSSLSLSATPTLTEAGGNIIYTATVTRAPVTPLLVTLSSGQTITILPGQLTGTVTVPVLADEDVYSDPTNVSAIITGTSGGGIAVTVNPAPAVTTITDTIDDTTITLTATPTVAEGGSIIYTATLTNPTDTPMTVTLSGGQVINIGANQTSGSVTVPAPADDVYIDNGSVSKAITGTTGGNFENLITNPAAAATTITDTINTTTVSITGDTNVIEGNTATYTVSLTNPAQSDLTINLAYSGTASNGADYIGVATVTIQAGQSSAIVSIPTLASPTSEPLENFTITINLGAGGNFENLVVSPTQGSITTNIADLNGPPTVFISNPTVVEGNLAVFTISLSSPSAANTDFTLALGSGSAIVGTDTANTLEYFDGSVWQPVVGGLTIPAGQTSLQVRVATLDDSYADNNETFTLTASITSGNTSSSTAFGTATITDEAVPDTVLVSLAGPAAVVEGVATTNYTVSLPQNAVSDVTVNLTYTGTASNGVDYTGVATVTILAGQNSATFNLATIDDAFADGGETIIVNLGSITGGGFEAIAANPAANSVTTTISDEAVPDTVLVSLAGPAAVVEGVATTNYTVSLPQNAVSDVTVNLTYTGTASNGVDYTGVATVTILAGQNSATFNLATIDDAFADGGETIIVNLGSITGGGFEAIAANPASNSVTTTIIDNEPTIDLDSNNSSGAPGSNYTTTFTENGAAVSIADTDIVIVDPVSLTMASATITLTNAQAGDVLAAVSGGGITANVVANVVTLSGTATLAQYQTAIQAITFSNTTEDPNPTPRNITVVLNDGVNITNTAIATVNVVPVNDPPVLDLDLSVAGTGYTTTYVENAAGTPISDTDVTITDVDDTNIESATITLTNAQAGDVLAALGALPGGITAVVSGGGSVVTLSGTATLAQYQAAIRLIGFSNTTDNPSTTPRTINVVVNDGTANSNTAVTTINVTAVNDAPVGVADNYTAVEGTTTVKTTVLVNDTDPEGNALTVTQFATTTSGSGALVANGTNTITTALGGTVVMNSDGTYTYTAPARNHGDATPDIDSFAYKASDGSLDSPWTTVNITITDTNPIANNDVDSVGIGSTVTGNVITGAGGVTADTLNVDSPFNLTNVVLTQGTLVSNTLGAGNVRTIVTTNGTLMMDQDDGSYSYTLATPPAISVASPTAVSSFTNAGFGVYGFDSTDGYITTGNPNSGLDLTDLNATSAARVSFSSGGIGPDDALTPSANQSRIEQGEELVFALPTTTKSATVTVTDLAADEVALWETYNASGALISSGSWPGGGAQSFTITAGTPFSYIVVRSGAGSSDEFRVTGISIQPEPSSVPDIFTYTLTDSDGDTSMATLTMNYDSNTTANNDTAFVFEAGINATATQDGGTQEAANSEIATGNILANDTGIASTTNITDVNGVTPVGGVITINNPNYTVQIYTQTVGAFVKGDYVVTLTGNTTEGVDDVIALNYQLQNSLTGELDNATLTVNIVDDVPTVQDAIVQVQQGVLPKQNLVFVIDSSGSMAGEVKNVAANGTVTIQNRLQATLQAVTAVINEYFSQGGNVSITLIDFDATATNRGTFTTAASAIAALNTPANFVVGGGTNYEAALQVAQAAMTPPVVGERYTTYFISDGVPTVGDITDPAANGYRAFATANNVTTYAIGIASDISNPTELNNIHNVDSDNSGVKDNAIIVTNVATLDEVLLASVPTTFGGSVAGSTANSSLNFGADGGYISQLIMRLDTNGDNVPDADVTFNFNPTTGAITVVGGGVPQAAIPSPSDTITLNDARGFEDGILIFNFRTGEYVYQTAGFAAEGEQFDIKFTATDGDGDTASGKQTLQIVDGKPDANNDIDTLRGGQTFFEGNVISAIGTDGGDSVALTSFSSNRSGEDNPGDGGRVSSIVFKGVTFDLTTLVGSTAALGGNYTVTNIGGVNTLTWTASAGGSSLVFNASGYYRYTPPTAEISNNVVGASTTYNLDTAGNITTAATAGMTLTAIARASATEGSATVNPVGGDGTGVTGGGNNNNQIDDLESLVITFNTALHPRGVQGVVINVDASNSNLGGTNAFNYNVYDVHGDLIGQFASNAEGNVTIPFAGIGKIIVDSGTIDTSSYPGSAGSIFSVTYQTILATAGTPAPAPEVISYTLRDTDGDTSTATLTLNNIIDDFAGTAANNTINGTARNENISGFAGNDTINAGAGHDIVRGGDGDDVVDGGADNDQLYGEAGNDTISGGTGNDSIYGDAGNDALSGNDGDDYIDGGAGNDIINGGLGADVILGGAGNDTLTGGSVGIVDTFRWELADRGTTSAPATDVITDFDPAAVGAGGDVLDLRDLLSGESHAGVDSGNLASYLHFEVVGANTVIHISNNGGFSNGFSPTKDVQKITLTDVDLVTGFADDNAIIQNLLTNNKLITD